MDVYTFAKSYVAAGWEVFPILYKSKIPATSHGLKDSSKDLYSLRSAFLQFEKPINIAIRTGSCSNVYVLDIDKDKGGLESLDILKREFGFPKECYIVKTGTGGYHYYFRFVNLLPGVSSEAGVQRLTNRVNLLPGVDFRGENGYVVAPPSVHENGNPYTLIQGCDILPEIPTWLLGLLSEPSTCASNSLKEGETIPSGMRNEFLFKTACRLKRVGLSPDSIREAVNTENDTRCSPPLSTREVELILDSASRYQSGDPIKVNNEETYVVKGSELLVPMVQYLKDKDKVMGQDTFLKPLNKLLGGGYRTGELTAWHAIAKTGKNTLWHKLLHLQLINDIPQGYASRELTPETEVLPNLLSIACDLNAWKLDITDDLTDIYKSYLDRWPIYFAKGYGYFPISQLHKWIRALKQRGIENFWFDHLHYMLEDPEDHKAASKLIKELKTLAKSEDVHINLIIQPNKIFENAALSMNTLKGGSAIGQAIDTLICLSRVPTAENVMQVSLVDARNKLCKLGTFYMKYNPETTDMWACDKPATPQTGQMHDLSQYMLSQAPELPNE